MAPTDRIKLRSWLSDVAAMAIDALDALDAHEADLEDDEREVCCEDDLVLGRAA